MKSWLMNENFWINLLSDEVKVNGDIAKMLPQIKDCIKLCQKLLMTDELINR